MHNLQQAQITAMINDNLDQQLERVNIIEFQGAYYLHYCFFSRENQDIFKVTLYTQKNKIRVFKTLDASFKHVKHLTHLFNDDGKIIGLNDVSIAVVPDFCYA